MIHARPQRGVPAVVAVVLSAAVARAQWLEPQVAPLLEIVSPTTQDAFGWLVRSIGDVNGDGVPDLVTCAPLNGSGASAGGLVSARSGSNGAVLWSRAEPLTSAILGYSLETLDWNHDGVLDVLAAAPFNGADGGFVRVLSGVDGALLHTFDSGVAAESFGASIALGGDWNGDGVDDIAIGAAGHDVPAPETGRVYVYSGVGGALLAEIAAPPASAGELEFGFGLCFVRDVSTPADGRDELIVGRRGAVFPAGRAIALENTGAAVNVLYDIAVAADYNLQGNRFASGGDIDGDGSADFVVGSNVANVARVYSARNGALVREFTTMGPAGSGGVAQLIHDLDADGCSDVLVGERGDDSGASNAGRALIYSGRSGALLASMTSTLANRRFGAQVAVLHDHDDDGALDVVLSGAGGGTSGPPAGSLVVLRGAPSVATYCTSKLSSSGCSPAIEGLGIPSLRAPGAFALATQGLEANTSALSFFSLAAGSPTPFRGGWYCVGTPVARLPLRSSGGLAVCSGSIGYTLADVLATPAGAANVVAGQHLHVQTWGRDAGDPFGVSLSDAVRLIVAP